MVIKAENTVDFDDIKRLNKIDSQPVKIMLTAFAGAMLVLIGIALCTGNFERNLKLGIAGLIWCAFVYSYMFIINPRLTYKNFRKKYGNALVKYTLNQKSMEISIENSDGNWEIRKNYRDMFKIHETDDYFFIHVKRNEAYILKKSCIVQGSPQDISAAVAEEMGSKFIVKK